MAIAKKMDLGRLALRVEGEFWNAYYAAPDTMRGAILLGSIRMNLVGDNPHMKKSFMGLMQDCVDVVIKQVTGQTPGWKDPQDAPESERSGNA